MLLAVVFILTALIAIACIPFVDTKWKGVFAIVAVSINTVLSGFIAIKSLTGTNTLLEFPGSFVTVPIPI